MNKEKTIEFRGEQYFDDRLFILYLCPGNIDEQPDEDGLIHTTIYHENPPEKYIWCVVTYRNSPGYPIVGVKHFSSRERAVIYMWHIEPETPMISLNGKSPEQPLQYQEYSAWKKKNNLKEFDFHDVYMSGGENAREIITQTKDQFKGFDIKI